MNRHSGIDLPTMSVTQTGRSLYEVLLAEAARLGAPVMDFLRKELPHLWLYAYQEMTPRMTNIITVNQGSFDYIYDNYAELEATGAVPADDVTESRLVAAVGVSVAATRSRRHDDGRLKGWVGPTNSTFGEMWDKGHFIAHTIGGAVDGLEMNVFKQLRAVNRGEYRRLERYCADNPGTFCFSRPVYEDPSAVPVAVEFGVLTGDGVLDVRVFANR